MALALCRVLRGSDGKAYALSNFKDKSPVVVRHLPWGQPAVMAAVYTAPLVHENLQQTSQFDFHAS